MQTTSPIRHVVSWRDNLGTVRFYKHSILYIEDLHPCVTPNKIGEDGFLVWRHMLNQHKSHVWIDINRHPGEKSFKGSEASCGCPYADNRTCS